MLEHAYFSNDESPSHLHGPIPDSMGNLTSLRCIYFSHTGVEGVIPRSLEKLVNLEVFLMRCNHLTGPLIDFSKLPRLKNVWFDTQNGSKPLTGTLTALGGLKNLSFLQAHRMLGDAAGRLLQTYTMRTSAEGQAAAAAEHGRMLPAVKINRSRF